MSTSSSATPESEPSAGSRIVGRSPFDSEDYYGEYLDETMPGPLDGRIGSLVDPGSAHESLHWGRNYLYVTDWEGPEGTIEAVVKQFRNQGLKARLRKMVRGSRARANWQAALCLVEAGIETPKPLMWIESKGEGGPSFFVSQRLVGYFEIREIFRALKAGEMESRFPDIEPKVLFVSLARFLRPLHDAGVFHRDLSIGNILVRRDPEGGFEFSLVDLNRARLGAELSSWRRSRDLSRLPIIWPGLRSAFLNAYWGTEVSGGGSRSLLFRVHCGAFLAKHWFKNNVRTPLRSLFPTFGPRRPHVHIPEVPEGASSRDKVVWDRLSDQPHQHASKLEKSKLRLADMPAHGRTAVHGIAALPRLRRRYRQLQKGLYREPIDWGVMGVALRPFEPEPEAPLRLVERLGVRHALLRLHTWEESHDAELELARELRARGCDLAFALPQNRDLVRDQSRWRAAIERLAEQFVPLGRSFQIGQAVNRSKWGIWKPSEYLDMAASASEILKSQGEVTLMGPAVIDFEAHALVGLLNLPDERVHFDVAAHLLYVDRRGAPENRQLGFDTVDKVALMHAAAETSRLCGPRSWITEVNWPLREGPHSPAGRDVAVDEESQADYLARYYILSLGTGLIERVYWWQLIARGYGLVSPADGEDLRCRPAFGALATLFSQLEGSRFQRPLPSADDVRLYLFERGGRELVVGWCAGNPTWVSLPRPAVGGVDRDGNEISGGSEIELTPSPRYLTLEESH